MIDLKDGRIGMRDESGKIVIYPTHFATGGIWNRKNYPTPTTTWFGENRRYFYVLPINVARITEDLREELLNLTVKLVTKPAPKVIKESIPGDEE